MKRLDIEQGAERALNLLRAMTLEIQMLARACGKSDVHHLEPEDMAALTMEASIICGVPLAGTSKVFGRSSKGACDVIPVTLPTLRRSQRLRVSFWR